MIRNKEYLSIVYPILTHNEFKKLRKIQHHRNHSIYRHSVKVSFLTYKITKKLNLDYHSATRGSLLHDFFLYDWKTMGKKPKKISEFHAFMHPKIALENALRHFELNNKEKDIVLKHMYPLCIIPPKHIESWIVSLIDKFTALKEVLRKDA